MVWAKPMKYEQFTKDNYRLNRTIVSDDIEPILNSISSELALPIHIHRYQSGDDIGSWIIPPSWNVKEAWIKDRSGKIIASYEEHPLFLAPYSAPFSGQVSKKTLEKHVRFHPTRRDDYYYEHRLAYNYPMRLSDWVVTMPRNRFDALPEQDYEVHIDIDVAPGEMLVGEVTIQGESDRTIALLVDYCHPGQVNDSWSGILAMFEVIKILQQRKELYFTYKLLLFPETIGSCVYLETNQVFLEKCELAIFSEFVAWGSNWKILAGDRRDGYAKNICKIAQKMDADFTLAGLYEGYGNDEIIFDYAGVPSISVQMTECDEYHSSSDDVGLIEQGNIDKAARMILEIINVAEKNRPVRLKYRVPVYMTRYDLYDDAVYSNKKFLQNRFIMNGLNDGLSILDISLKYKIPFNDVVNYVNKIEANNLLEKL